MPTSLGGSANVGMRLMVYNPVENGTIPRGYAVSWFAVSSGNPAIAYLDKTQNKDYGSGTQQQLNVPYLVVAVTPADTNVPGGAGRLGVAAADILPGKFGEIIVYGLAMVYFPASAAITCGEVITANSSGQGIDAANASHDNPIGVVVETVSTTAGLRWAFINCLASAGASSTAFMGKAY